MQLAVKERTSFTVNTKSDQNPSNMPSVYSVRREHDRRASVRVLPGGVRDSSDQHELLSVGAVAEPRRAEASKGGDRPRAEGTQRELHVQRTGADGVPGSRGGWSVRQSDSFIWSFYAVVSTVLIKLLILCLFNDVLQTAIAISAQTEL